MRHFIHHTSTKTRKSWEEFSSFLDGIDPNAKKDRWKICVSEIEKTLPFLAAEFYMRENFSGDVKHRGTLFVEQIRDAFIERLMEVDWIDKDTREIAINKAKHIHIKMGSDERFADPFNLAKYVFN